MAAAKVRNGVASVQRAGETQWRRAAGLPSVETKADAWIDRRLVNIAYETVMRVLITQSDGSVMSFERLFPESKDFSVSAQPEGRALFAPQLSGTVPVLLENLEMVDAMEASRLDPAAERIITSFATYRGLVIYVESTSFDGGQWSTLRAVAPPLPQGRNAVIKPELQAVLNEAAAINLRLSRWAFRLPEDREGLMTIRLRGLPSEQVN